MKKNYIEPIVMVNNITTSKIFASSTNPSIFSEQADKGSEALSKTSGWDDDENFGY